MSKDRKGSNNPIYDKTKSEETLIKLLHIFLAALQQEK